LPRGPLLGFGAGAEPHRRGAVGEARGTSWTGAVEVIEQREAPTLGLRHDQRQGLARPDQRKDLDDRRRLECGVALGIDQEQRQRAGADSPAGGCVNPPSQPAKERSAGLSKSARGKRDSHDKGRASVEREFGRLKNEWALLPLRCADWIGSR
jgi:hypothetical protein